MSKKGDRTDYSRKANKSHTSTKNTSVTRTNVRLTDIKREAIGYSIQHCDRDPICGAIVSTILYSFCEYLTEKLLAGERLGWQIPEPIAARLHHGFPHVQPDGEAPPDPLAAALRHHHRPEPDVRPDESKGDVPDHPQDTGRTEAPAD